MKLRTKLITAAAVIIAAVLASSSLEAKKMSDLKIYINPGHGGYSGDDRPIHIYPYASGDTLGYWESKSNLYKGLHMYHILDSLGATAYMSRVKNTEDDDRSLSGIGIEATNLGCDLFFSIHTNAGENVNYPLMLYREDRDASGNITGPRYPGNVTISEILGKTLYSNKLSNYTHNYRVCGDLTFGMYYTGYGILRNTYVVAVLSEGAMHEHRPEAHRLMNDDYCWLDAWHFVRATMEYFDTEDRFVTGNVAGIVYDDHNLRSYQIPENCTSHGRDKLLALNGVFVELIDESGKTIQTRTTDNDYNGVYVFRNVTPGKYTVRCTHDSYYVSESAVTVTANEVTYQDMPLNMRREAPLAITAYSPNVAAEELVSCATTIELDFNTDIDVPSFEAGFKIEPSVDGYLTYSNSYRHVTFTPTVSFERNTKYTVTIDQSTKSADTHYSHPQMEAPVVFSFTTQSRDRLEIVNTFPAEGGTVHYAAAQVEIRFDNSLDRTGVTDIISLKDSKGNEVPLNVRTTNTKINTLANNFGNVIASFSSDLVPGEKYTFRIGGEVRDLEGIPLVNEKVINFTAVDATTSDFGDYDVQIFDNFESAANFVGNEEASINLAAKPTAAKSTSVKLFDKAGSRLQYRFADTHDCQAVWNYTGTSSHFYTGDHLGMYIYGDFSNHELWVGLSAGTNVKYNKVCDLDFLGWKYVEVELNNLEADFCPFKLNEVKLVQVTSPITQKGAFAFDNLTYIGTTASVSDIVNDASNLMKAFVDGGNIYVNGLEAGSKVNLFNLNGVLLTSVIAEADGSVCINASHLGHGVFILASGPQVLRVAL